MLMIANMQRRKELFKFGFGTDVMKNTTVCTNCNSMQSAKNKICSKCKAELSNVTLYDYYRAQHKACQYCNTVLSDAMQYCPKCGIAIKETE